jgi:uncharacterized protein (DUF885 family)
VLAALISAGRAGAAPADTLHALLKDYDSYLAKVDPVTAGERGDLAAARRWPDDSPAEVSVRHREVQEFHDRLTAIRPADLAGEDALNRALLADRVDLDLAGSAFDEERMPFTSDEGFFTLPAEMAGETRLRGPAEADAYLARLAALPAFYASETADMRRGIATGFVQPRLIALAAARAGAGLQDR